MRRSYAGGAQPAQLTVDLGGSTADLTIICDDLTGYPTGSAGPFYIVIDRGLAAEEKILCASRTGNTISVYNVGLTNGRGADGTAVIAHTANATVEHVFTAVDADEANAHVNTTTGTVHGLTIADVVTTGATQTLGNKTLSSPTISTPAITGGSASNVAISGGTITGSTISGSTFSGGVTSTSVTLTGSQTLNSYRARNIYGSTVAPTAGSGNDGDLWVQYEA